MYSILNKAGIMPNDVPFHMRNVGLRSIHISNFHMLSTLLIYKYYISERVIVRMFTLRK